MSTRIRLSRAGRKGKHFYHVVVADIRSKRDGKFIEKLGFYDPLASSDSENRFKINQERAEYWLANGAVPSERVAIFLCNMGIKGAQKYKPVFIPKAKKIKEVVKTVPVDITPIEVSEEEVKKEIKEIVKEEVSEEAMEEGVAEA